jgi:DNA helicase II / ATP-dependent DNA helicase PcrA
VELTSEQKLILANCQKNIYISAGPGSGKSTLLSVISSKLLEDPNNRILLVTFTNQAAKSIISKCSNLDHTRIIGGTFHGLAFKFMKLNNRFFNICDENKKTMIIKKIFNCRKDKEKLGRIYDHIDEHKREWPLVTDDIITKYQDELAKYNLLDFDDIIYRFIDLLQDTSFGLPTITHIIVDELQDTSGPQLEMLVRLQTKLQCNMIAAADDDQSIYKWRGARPQNVRDFISIFKCTTLNMGYNFRSANSIVEGASKLINYNKDRISKIFTPARNLRGIVGIRCCNDPFDEIKEITIHCRRYPKNDITILYRTRQYKNYIEFELRKAGIKYSVNDMFDLTDRSAIKAVVAVLKIASDQFDIYDLEQASKCIAGFGLGTIKALETKAKDEPIANVFKSSLDKNAKLKSFKELISIFNTNQVKTLSWFVQQVELKMTKSFLDNSYQPDMRSFLIDISKDFKCTKLSIKELVDELGLDGNQEKKEKEKARVELSTIHGYKGKEADIIIIPFANMFDEKKEDDEQDSIEDNRRLFYVAVTRARDNLFISYSGNMRPRFIREME